MSTLVCVLLSALVLVNSVDAQNAGKESAREEKLRSALIDAFQTIKKASGKGDLDDEGVDLLDSLIASANSSTKGRVTKEEPFELFVDDDGLSFADFSDFDTEKNKSTIESGHNVQHIVKANNKPPEKGNSKPTRDILGKLNDSIRTTLNESKNMPRRESALNTKPMGIENILRLFDADILVKQWPQLQQSVKGECRADMQKYVDGLTQRKLWALKMEDASGRYTSMFYWGNNYWTGSAELCDILNNENEPARAANKSITSHVFNDWRQDVSMAGSGPPFETAFYVARVVITTNLTEIVKTKRTLHLGMCLPYTCSRYSVASLVSNARAPLLHHKVTAIRSPQHGGYNYLTDPTFWVLVSVSILVSIVLIAATLYDLKISRDVRRRRQRAANLAANTATRNDLKLDISTLNNVTVANGKYNVNNNLAMNSNTSEEHLTVETASTDELKLSVWSELLLSFSMKANILQIFDQSVGADTVPVVHGLRTMSMVWVIFGHTCIVVFKIICLLTGLEINIIIGALPFQYADNTALRAILEKSFWFQLIISAVYSVDTFFCLGGMLVTFLYFRTKSKGKLDVLVEGRKKFTSGVLQFLGLIGYRFARLTAPYLFILGVVEVTMKWFAYNSVFEPPAMDHDTCPKYWWRNLLYINTLFPVDQMCMLWSWYLSDDTQFYAVSAILLILATSHFKVSAILTGLLFLSSLFTTGYVSWSSNHIPNPEDPFTQFDKVYEKPWTRLGPYLVGMLTGWILFKTNLKIKMKPIWAWVGWTICTATLLFLIFGLYKTELGVWSAAIYSALSHSMWAACIGWIIIACSTGYGGLLTPLLSAPVLYPFSRVTYCAYLVHPLVLRYVAMHLTHPIHMGELLVFILFLGLAVISYVLAFVISVAFEAPIVTMLKIVAPTKKPHRV